MNQKKVISISFIFLSLLMVILALSYWANADDFCFRSKVLNNRLSDYLISYYYSWSGRIFTLGILGVMIKLLPISHSNIISSIFVLLYIASLYVFVRYWQKYINAQIWTGLLVSFFLFWFGLRGIIGEVVYWPTGAATYLVPFILGLWWMDRFDLDLQDSHPGTLKIILSFLFSLIVGNGIEVLSPILCAYGFFMILDSKKLLSKRNLILQCSKLLGIIFGTLFLVLAPGNLERAKSFPQGITLDGISLVKNLFNVNWVFFSYTKTMLLYAIISSLILIILTPDLKIEIKKIRKMSLIFFLTSLASLLPMATVDLRFSTRRTTFYFAVILSLALVFLILSFHEKIRTKLKILNKPNVQIFALLIMIVSPATSLILDIKQALPMRENFLNRHQVLSSQPKDSAEMIVLQTLGKKAPKSLFYEEITPDETHWVNSCIAHYYHIKNIRLKIDGKE